MAGRVCCSESGRLQIDLSSLESILLARVAWPIGCDRSHRLGSSPIVGAPAEADGDGRDNRSEAELAPLFYSKRLGQTAAGCPAMRGETSVRRERGNGGARYGHITVLCAVDPFPNPGSGEPGYSPPASWERGTFWDPCVNGRSSTTEATIMTPTMTGKNTMVAARRRAARQGAGRQRVIRRTARLRRLPPPDTPLLFPTGSTETRFMDMGSCGGV